MRHGAVSQATAATPGTGSQQVIAISIDAQGRYFLGSEVLEPEALKARLNPGTRTVSAMADGVMVALCEMRAGRLEPSRVFNL